MDDEESKVAELLLGCLGLESRSLLLNLHWPFLWVSEVRSV